MLGGCQPLEEGSKPSLGAFIIDYEREAREPALSDHAPKLKVKNQSQTGDFPPALGLEGGLLPFLIIELVVKSSGPGFALIC